MSIARRAIQRLSRNRVLKRRLPNDFSSLPILVSPDASLRFWRQPVESDLFDFAREFARPNSMVWDIGANVGLFTFAAAQRSGSSGMVVAVEADIWLAGLLRRSAKMQPATCAPVHVIPAAVSNSIGVVSFDVAEAGRASNHLSVLEGSTQTGGIRETVPVVTITLDLLLEQYAAPNVLKIDVEGAELRVLRGGMRTISEARPVILCEVSKEPSEITELLTGNGYVLYDWERRPRTRVERACYNTLAVPA